VDADFDVDLRWADPALPAQVDKFFAKIRERMANVDCSKTSQALRLS
jgi:hypothetical protein